jgi:hypothetical protein
VSEVRVANDMPKDTGCIGYDGRRASEKRVIGKLFLKIAQILFMRGTIVET